MSFFAHPLRVLNEILDPSTAASARRENSAAQGREVRLRQFAFALRDAALGLRRSALKFHRPLRGRAGLGKALEGMPMRKSRQATEDEG